MVVNLLARDDVWWSPLLFPGRWEAVTGEAAAAFLERWIGEDRKSSRPPFAVLYPPLKILRLELDFAPVTLWQVAVDVCFDVGVVDLIEQPAPRPNPDWVQWQARLRETAHSLESTLAPEVGPSETEEARKDDRSEMSDSRRLSYLAENWRGLPQLRGGLVAPETSLGPASVSTLLSRTPEIRGDADAAKYASLVLSLSRREVGRLSIVDPACSLAFLPNGPHAVTIDLSDLPVAAPSAVETDVGWDFACDAWLGDGIWRLQGKISKSASIVMCGANRIAIVRPKPPEAYVGWVRLFDCQLPDKVRVARGESRI